MTFYSLFFYLLSALILGATVAAITRRNLVHAVIYLVLSFFGSAMLFYLLGAPFLAAVELIIYAGAIMILFLFIVMMIDVTRHQEKIFPMRQWAPAAAMGLIYAAVALLLPFVPGAGGQAPMRLAEVAPGAFGLYLFQRNYLAIEIVSFLLLVALVGALYLGRLRESAQKPQGKIV